MIELPEAVTIAKQLGRQLQGRRTVSAGTGSSPHKWVFYRPERKELEKKLSGKAVGEAGSVGRGIHVEFGRGLTLVIDDFGGRVLYHGPGEKVPKNFHLLVGFDDDSSLSVAIQGWGFIALLTGRQLREHVQKRAAGLSPVGRAWTLKGFCAAFDRYEQPGKDSVKQFFTNGKSVAGIGNGYLQDILFRAGIDPRRKVATITAGEKKALHRAVGETIKQACALGGRACERDLFGRPGQYEPVMDQHAKGRPCPVCGTPIEGIHYLGGSCYVCPKCQT